MELSKPANAPTNSPFNALITMFYEPGRAFAMLEPKRHAWLPLLLVILVTAALMSWYFSVVDFSWFVDQMLASIKDATQREQSKAMMSRFLMQTTTTAAAVITLPVACALAGVYFMVVGKTMNKNMDFGDGFALAAWASVPALLMLPLGAIAINMASDGQLGFSELNPLSLNQLFFQYEMAHPMAGVLDTISFTGIWSVILTIIGFQVWAKVPLSTALKVVLIPYVTIFALWFAFAMSKAT